MTLRAWIVAAIAAAVLLANRLGHFDVDAGGYRPALGNLASYPKAYVHGVTAFAATLAAAIFTGAPIVAAVIVTLGAVLWEMTQGFFNWLDVAAGVVGATVAVALVLLA